MNGNEKKNQFLRPRCQIAVKNPTNVGSLYHVTYSKEGYEGICVLYQTAPARQLQTDLYLCQKNVTRRPERATGQDVEDSYRDMSYLTFNW